MIKLGRHHISKIEGILTVISPMEGSPAEKEGLKPGDLVIKVNDQPLERLWMGKIEKGRR